MKFSTQRRLGKWRAGSNAAGTTIEVPYADYDKIKIRRSGNANALFLGGGPSYIALKREVNDYMDRCLSRMEEDSWGNRCIRFHFFHEEDALQFKLQFL